MEPKEKGEAKTDKLNKSAHGFLLVGNGILSLLHPALCSLNSH